MARHRRRRHRPAPPPPAPPPAASCARFASCSPPPPSTSCRRGPLRREHEEEPVDGDDHRLAASGATGSGRGPSRAARRRWSGSSSARRRRAQLELVELHVRPTREAERRRRCRRRTARASRTAATAAFAIIRLRCEAADLVAKELPIALCRDRARWFESRSSAWLFAARRSFLGPSASAADERAMDAPIKSSSPATPATSTSFEHLRRSTRSTAIRTCSASATSSARRGGGARRTPRRRRCPPTSSTPLPDGIALRLHRVAQRRRPRSRPAGGVRRGGRRRRRARRRCCRRRRPASSASTSSSADGRAAWQLADVRSEAAAVYAPTAAHPRQVRCPPTCCPRPTCPSGLDGGGSPSDAPAYHFVGTEGQWYQRPPHRRARAAPTSAGFSRWQRCRRTRSKVRSRGAVCRGARLSRPPAPLPGGSLSRCAPWRPWTPCSWRLCLPMRPSARTRTRRWPTRRRRALAAAARAAAARGGKRNASFQGRALVGQHDCWFCMSSEKFEAHLLASVGEESYVALPKGPLVSSHALVIPVAHKASSLELTDAESAEVEKYVGGLRKCFAAQGEELVLFERFMCAGSPRPSHTPSVRLAVHSQCRCLSTRAGATRSSNTSTCRPSPSPPPPPPAPRRSSSTAARGIRFDLLPRATALRDAMPRPEAFFAVTLPSGERLLHRMAPTRAACSTSARRSPRCSAPRSAPTGRTACRSSPSEARPRDARGRVGDGQASSARTTRCARRAELGTIVPNPLAFSLRYSLAKAICRRGPPPPPPRRRRRGDRGSAS